MPAADEVRALPRDRALMVYWKGESVTGLLLYGLRSPDERPQVDVDDAWPEKTEASPPWLLHGEGWAVDLWTIRLERMPESSEWRAMLESATHRLLEAGYVVAWFAIEGDFADPPALFDPAVMGQGVYAAASRASGFICRDEGTGDLRVLTDTDLARLRGPAAAVWSARDADPFP